MIRGVMDDAITGSFIQHKETWASSIDDTSPSQQPTALCNKPQILWVVGNTVQIQMQIQNILVGNTVQIKLQMQIHNIVCRWYIIQPPALKWIEYRTCIALKYRTVVQWNTELGISDSSRGEQMNTAVSVLPLILTTVFAVVFEGWFSWRGQ